MDASLDTDIIIHLYLSGLQDLFLTIFDRLYYHEYLLENELKKKSRQIYDQVMTDIKQGRLFVVYNKELTAKGVRGLFDSYIREYDILFDSGEAHAIALAKALGLVALLSDDTKEFGPHDLLVRELIQDVIPFAFYELLFIQYLASKLSLEEMNRSFELVNEKSIPNRPMDFKARMKRTVKRFSYPSGTKRDIKWIKSYCEENGIDFENKMCTLEHMEVMGIHQ